MNFTRLLAKGRLQLEEAGVSEAELDARLLLEAASGRSRTEIYLYGNDQVEQEVIERFSSFLSRRCLREPVAYILQQREFWSLSFYINRHVLIPRPETEFLLETVFACAAAENFIRGGVLDLCTGSGVVGVVLAKEREDARIIASDISPQALAVACRNAYTHRVAQRFSPLCCDLLSAIAPFSLSLVVANPPYVTTKEMVCELAPEVYDFEPHLALDGGDDGLALIRKIEQQLCSCLLIFQDYTGRNRVLWAKKA